MDSESDYNHDRDDRIDQWRRAKDSKPTKPYCDRLPMMDKNKESLAACERYLVARNLDPDIARANQWYPSVAAGDENLRLVIPASSDQDGNHFWQSRLVLGAGTRYQSPAGCTSGDAVIVVYPAGAARWKESVVVEGPMCALAVAMTGRLGVALMGADPPEERLELTARRVHGTTCTIIPDQDRLDALVRVFAYLTNKGVQCRLRDPFHGKDFADMSPEARTQLLR